MSLTTMKEILAPLSSATDAMSDALQQAQDELNDGVRGARKSLAAGAQRSLRNASTSRDRAQRAWSERADLVREQSSDAADRAIGAYRVAMDAMAATWSRAMKAMRSAGDQAYDLEERVRRDAQVYSKRGATWARKNPHIIAGVVAVAGYFIIRSYRKRLQQRRLEAEQAEVNHSAGDAANEEAIPAKRSA